MSGGLGRRNGGIGFGLVFDFREKFVLDHSDHFGRFGFAKRLEQRRSTS